MNNEQKKMLEKVSQTVGIWVCSYLDIQPEELESNPVLSELPEGDYITLQQMYLRIEKELGLDLPVDNFVDFFAKFPHFHDFLDFFVTAMFQKHNLLD